MTSCALFVLYSRMYYTSVFLKSTPASCFSTFYVSVFCINESVSQSNLDGEEG